MNKAERTILRLLREKSPQYGLDLVRASRGALRRGTVYVHLHALEREGFIRSEKGTKLTPLLGNVRRIYFLVGKGRQALIDEESPQGFGGLPEGSPA